MVMHLDTLARDMAYLSQKLNLNIDPGFVRREGGGGRTSQNRSKHTTKGEKKIEIFSTLSSGHLRLSEESIQRQ